MADGQVVFEISADGKKAMASINDIIAAMEKAGKKLDGQAEQTTNSIGDKFTGMFKKITAAAVAAKVGKVLVSWAKDAIEAASALEEVQNVVDVTFGESAAEIDAWAKNAIVQFGLTETQAKQFSSTMGAMMKSSGLAGQQIVGMSENLAGLAADMASFYNMDFETAFNKIRSGISGETEPLKQLGINMSVANLEAFALTQGITKAFDKMSQSEQIVLRYQYLMQATADAQGDFARTSDGYANGLRLLDSQLNQLKTTVGGFLIGPAADAVGWLNDFLGTLTQPKQRTVLDDFADIEAETNQKIANIGAKANEARALIDALDGIAGKEMTASGLTEFVTTLNEQFGGMDEAIKKAKTGNYAATIRSVAMALSTKLGGDPQKWEDLLTAIGNKLPSVNTAVANGEGTPDYLKSAAEAANELGYTTGQRWADLVSALGEEKALTMLTALKDAKTGAEALETFATGANSLKSTSKNAWEGLLGAINNSGGLAGIFDNAPNASGNITAIAEAFNKANLDTNKTSAWRQLLTVFQNNKDGLSELSGMTSSEVDTFLGDLATKANTLDLNAPGAWNSLISLITEKVPALDAKVGSSASNITALAEALSGSNDKVSKADAWQSLLTTFTNNIDGIAALRGSTSEETYAWLGNLADQANKLDPNDAAGWETLFNALIEGLPHIADTDEGKEALESLQKVEGVYDSYGEYLEALGIDTEGITNTQEAWLSIIQKLIKTIPGLASIINLETGEVKDGSDALRAYVDAWEQGQTKLAMMKAVDAKEAALSSYYEKIPEYELEAALAKYRAKRAKEAFIAEAGMREDLAIQAAENYEAEGENVPWASYSVWKDYETKAEVAERGLQRQKDALKEAEAAIKEYRDAVNDIPDPLGIATNATNENGAAVEAWSEDVQAAAAQAYNALADASTELASYMENVRSQVERQVEHTVKGFDKIKKASDKWKEARENVDDLYAELDKAKDASERKEISIRITGAEEALATVGNMSTALESQLAYMQEYMENLETAKQKGASDDLLAFLSDGSEESAMYLHALANASEEEVKKLSKTYEDVAAKRQEFTDTLTANQLNADDQFQALLDKTNELIAQLNQYDTAKEAIGHTVQGIAEGIAAHIPDVELQVQNLSNALSRLEALSSIGGFGYSGGMVGLFRGVSNFILGSHANGLDSVPFDGWAFLHQGERVQTAAEADLSRRHSLGTPAAMDYGAMGSAMWENAPNLGGNVYLDGQTVGKIISGRQADSYRALERSGWKG